MAGQITLRMHRDAVTFRKSTEVAALRAAPGAALALAARLADEAAAGRLRRLGQLGRFELVAPVTAPDAPAGTEADRLETWLDAARRARDVAAGSHVWTTSDDGVPFLPTGEIHLIFDPTLSDAAMNAIIARHGLVLAECRGRGAFVAQTGPRASNPMRVAAALAAEAGVFLAEPDLASPMVRHRAPGGAESAAGDPWHLENTGFHNGAGVGFRAGADARVVRAWEALDRGGRGRGRDDIRIAMIDDGFDLAHPDMAGRCVASHDFTRRSADVSPDWGDWHGAACAGLALAGGVSGRTIGAAPDARLVALRWGRDLSDREVEAWFAHAGRCEAAILSAAWGPAARIYPLSTRKAEAIRRLAREGRGGRGCVVVVSAGAQGWDFDAPEDAPDRALNGFAAHPDVVAVTATTSMDTLAEGANRGACIWLAAPAGGVGGWGVPTTDVSGFVTLPDGGVLHRGEGPGDRMVMPGGPSAACALTAGICALVLSANPTLTARDVRALLAETARPLPDQRAPAEIAEGSAGARRDPRYGHGCVDAYAAVLAASQMPGARALAMLGDETGCGHIPAPAP